VPFQRREASALARNDPAGGEQIAAVSAFTAGNRANDFLGVSVSEDHFHEHKWGWLKLWPKLSLTTYNDVSS